MIGSLERESFLIAYIKWHYGRGLREFWAVAGNFLWFISHFFSFKLLLKTLFAPWKRLGERYQGGLDLGAFASAAIVNALMRAFGLVSRSVVIVLGLVSYIAVAAFAALVFAVWLLAPLVLMGSLILSGIFFIA